MSGGESEKVDFRVEYRPCPADKEFPLTPQEAWYILQGYAVRPARPVSLEEFPELPRQLELSDGYIMQPGTATTDEEMRPTGFDSRRVDGWPLPPHAMR
jgi:hypothetical protein